MSAKKGISEEEKYLVDHAMRIVSEIYRYIENVSEKSKNTHLKPSMYITLLASLVGGIIKMSLYPISILEDKNLTAKRKDELVKANYLGMKTRVADAVAAGFTAALNEKNRSDDVEFFVQIKEVSQPINKEPI